ncbi:S-adenosyl-L-methionine-dependent methyltransferase [Gigaspora rosea]|uniref:S-adenosyl-L-methionine-dependent methyltransferase n=1 Tax=Gigaspora rosea TaxID=44941 RepID=A0A397VXQ4_9GLOM|nr:S-adenosyl-L-methionine-dependent methyltransferase [Gigaspora rosea]
MEEVGKLSGEPTLRYLEDVSKLTKESSTTAIRNDEDLVPIPKKDYGGDRLALQHHLFKYLWQSNFSAPVEEKLKTGATVLDFGCGTVTWLIDLSSQYPNSKFFGVDQPYLLRVSTPTIPSNVTVQYYDILSSGLPFEDETFDFVYMRFMTGEIPEKQTERIINEFLRVLKVGGYLEIMDIDTEGRNEGPITHDLVSSVKLYYKATEKNPSMISKMKSLFNSNSRLTSIVSEDEYCPVGNWYGNIGEIALINWTLLLRQMKNYIIPFLCVSDNEYKKMVNEFVEEVDVFQTHWISTRVYGRKLM